VKPLSEDLRQRIVAARTDGAGTGEVSQRFGVSRKSVERFWKLHCTSGHCRPKQIGGYRQSRLKKHEKRLRRWIAQQADLTLVELQQRCQKELDVQIGLTALWHQLDRLGLSYKKNDARRRASAA
jgi:transposase